jgi:hypothetical protein
MPANMKLDYGEEVRIPTVNGQTLCFETFHENMDGCSYIRFVDADDNEIAYWVCDEWAESPQEVMGAIMGAIQNGVSLEGGE